MLNNRALRATLTSYYEAIGSHEFDAIPKYFTPSMTIVTLSGSQTLTGSQDFGSLPEIMDNMVFAGYQHRNGLLPRPVRSSTGASQLQFGEDSAY